MGQENKVSAGDISLYGIHVTTKRVHCRSTSTMRTPRPIARRNDIYCVMNCAKRQRTLLDVVFFLPWTHLRLPVICRILSERPRTSLACGSFLEYCILNSASDRIRRTRGSALELLCKMLQVLTKLLKRAARPCESSSVFADCWGTKTSCDRLFKVGSKGNKEFSNNEHATLHRHRQVVQ